ncbi:hypothetical protein T484DRAFT_1847485 [Baffinella frigidus]|nr:hypothetical protein T484DRAFT_1847485 [Cryptophyta sp. CCMP2293]
MLDEEFDLDSKHEAGMLAEVLDLDSVATTGKSESRAQTAKEVLELDSVAATGNSESRAQSSEHAYPLPDSSLTFSGYDDQFVKIRKEGGEDEEEEEGAGEKGQKEGQKEAEKKKKSKKGLLSSFEGEGVQKEAEKKKKSKKGLLSSFGGRDEDLGANMMLIMGQGTGTGRYKMDAEPLRDRIAAFCIRLSSPSAIAECVRLAVKNHASAVMFVFMSPAALPRLVSVKTRPLKRLVSVKMRSLPLSVLFLSSSAAFQLRDGDWATVSVPSDAPLLEAAVAAVRDEHPMVRRAACDALCEMALIPAPAKPSDPSWRGGDYVPGVVTHLPLWTNAAESVLEALATAATEDPDAGI